MDIIIENLVKSIDGRKAIDSISFQGRRGEIVGLFGPKGSGKSTTLKIIAGILPADSGSVTYAQSDPPPSPAKLKHRLGYLFEQNPLYGKMDIVDFLHLITRLHGIRNGEATARTKEVISLCGLEKEKHKTIQELSRGCRQRLGIAQALIHNPDVLILDEPIAGLDPKQSTAIQNIIKEVKKDRVTLLSSRTMNEIETTCDRFIIMNQGKVMFNGTTAEFLRQSETDLRFRVCIKGGDSAQIHAVLASLPHIQKITVASDCNFVCQCLSGSEFESAIFNVCQKNNWYISELTPIQTRMEDIFHKFTQN